MGVSGTSEYFGVLRVYVRPRPRTVPSYGIEGTVVHLASLDDG
jgi:hypothetical protein